MTHFVNINKEIPPYPHESHNTILLQLLGLALFNLCVGSIGIIFDQGGMVFNRNILSKWLTPSINLLHKNSDNSADWYDFLTNAAFSVSIAYVGIFIAFFFYRPVSLSLQNLELINSFVKISPKRLLWDKIINVTYTWASNRAYKDLFYSTTLSRGMRGLSSPTHFFNRRVIGGITNGIGTTTFFLGEILKYAGGRISSYLFLYFSYVSIFLFIYLLYSFLT